MATVLAVQYDATQEKLEVICDDYNERVIDGETHHVPIAGKVVRTIFVRDELAVLDPAAAALLTQFLKAIDPTTRKKAIADVTDPHAVSAQALTNQRDRAQLIAERQHAETEMLVAKKVATEHTQMAMGAIAIKEAAEARTAHLALEAAEHEAKIAKLKAEAAARTISVSAAQPTASMRPELELTKDGTGAVMDTMTTKTG